ncbi:MAG: ectoine/hydroxyectoine ABC transporter substrate-binding protein EhuB [Vicinamibacteria bacterium]
MALRAAASAVLLAAAAVAATAVLVPSAPALERIRETGVLRIGYAVEAPYAFIGSDGLVTGESPELAKLVAREMGVQRIEWILTTFDALIPDLREGRFDVVASGLFVTPEREALVAFAEPSLAVRAGLLVRKGNPLRLFDYRDAIADPAARIAVVAGSVEEHRLSARGLPPTRTLLVPDAITGCRAVESGAADALALSRPTTRLMARQFPGLESMAVVGSEAPGGPEAEFRVAAAFSRAHPALREAWNAAQARLVGGPEHLRAIAPFGFEAADLPSAPRSERAADR